MSFQMPLVFLFFLFMVLDSSIAAVLSRIIYITILLYFLMLYYVVVECFFPLLSLDAFPPTDSLDYISLVVI